MSPPRSLYREWVHTFKFVLGRSKSEMLYSSTGKLRVWTKRTSNDGEFDQQKSSIILFLQDYDVNNHRDVRDEADLIAVMAKHFPFINAIEITDEAGDGLLVYVDWP